MTHPVPPEAVLDTNILLDWLVFRNPQCARLEVALQSCALRWIATVAMRNELDRVLSAGRFAPWGPDLTAIRSAWERHCMVVETPEPPGPSGRFRCTDPDDQKFIDLAVVRRARWLLSRDHAVLKLGRRLRGVGVEVARPQVWSALCLSPG